MTKQQSIQGRVPCVSMLIALTVITLFSCSQKTLAQQWSTSGNDISSTNSGNVGVGTTSPGVKLDILSSVNLVARFGTTAADNSHVLIDAPTGFNANLTLQRAGVSKWFIGNRSPNDRFSFIQSTGVETLVLLQDGKVGIGTTSPLYSLDVNGGTNGFRVRAATTSINDAIATFENGSAIQIILRGNGNLGVGTVNPDARLSVVGAGTTLPTTYNAGDVATFVSPADGFTNIALVKGGIANPQGLHFGVNQAGLFSEIQASQDGVTTNRLILNRQGGNVGIGTPAPNFSLDVQGGRINASGGLCIAGDCKTAWSQVGGSPITSVFGRTGAVVAATNDYTWAQINKTTSSLADLQTRSAADLNAGTVPLARIGLSGTPSTSTFLRGDNTWATIPSGAVSTVFGRTGAVVAAANDYTWAQINKSTSSLGDLQTRSAGDLNAGTVPLARIGLSGTPSASTFLRGDNTWATIPSGSGAVTTVFGRTGAVVAATNDYTWAQINKTTSSLGDLQTRSAGDLNAGTVPLARLGLSGSASTSTFLRGDNTWAPVPSSQWTSGTNNISYSTGNVGIGTTSPAFLLDVSGSINNPFRVQDSSGREYFSTTTRTGTFGTVPVVSIGGRLVIDSTTADGGNETIVRRPVNSLILKPSDHPDLPGAFMVTQVGGSAILYAGQNANGNVGIGTTTPSAKLEVVGNINVSGTGNITATGTIEGGNIKAKYQDVAEWVESSQDLPTGTLVVLDHTKSNQVIASSQAYDTRVAGVISDQPGIMLGEGGAGKVLVATTGRVRVTVDASKGPIQIGDLLVTSDIPGVAMKSDAINVGGVQIHRPGTLVGKALEPLAKGKGQILVLLSLQ